MVKKIVIGVVLLFSAARLFFRHGDPPDVTAPAIPAAIAIGAGIGFLSGLTGTGGGIFLTPLLLFCHWATIRGAAAVSALFILVNSISGLRQKSGWDRNSETYRKRSSVSGK